MISVHIDECTFHLYISGERKRANHLNVTIHHIYLRHQILSGSQEKGHPIPLQEFPGIQNIGIFRCYGKISHSHTQQAHFTQQVRSILGDLRSIVHQDWGSFQATLETVNKHRLIGIPIGCSCITWWIYIAKKLLSVLIFHSSQSLKKHSSTSHSPTKQHPKHHPPPTRKNTPPPPKAPKAWRLSFQALRHKRNDICEEVRCEERYQSLWSPSTLPVPEAKWTPKTLKRRWIKPAKRLNLTHKYNLAKSIDPTIPNSSSTSTSKHHQSQTPRAQWPWDHFREHLQSNMDAHHFHRLSLAENFWILYRRGKEDSPTQNQVSLQ